MSFLVLNQVRKSFGSTTVLDGVSVEVERGETLVLLGPSGSGKTTLLRTLAGFESPDAGSLRLEGEEFTRTAPARRRFGVVFQHYALFPHLTVAENVAFGLDGMGDRGEVGRRVDEALARVELTGFESRRVHEISGGQQQRVAVARALAPNPRVLLLDEPLSNLDPNLREGTRRALKRTLSALGITAIWVTHEQEEAFEVGDRVALLDGGRLQQVGVPEDLYQRPDSLFVARFVGKASWLPARATATGARIASGDGDSVEWRARRVEGVEPGDEAVVVFRPESLRLLVDGAGGDGSETLGGVVGERRFTGASTLYRVRLDAGGELEVAGSSALASPEARVRVAPLPDGLQPSLFPRAQMPEPG